MKLTYFQLEPHLSKTLLPAYVISGEEILLMEDAAKMLRKAAKKAAYHEHVRISPDSSFDWEGLHTLLYSTSLFGEKRLIELDFRNTAPPKAAASLLVDYAKKTSPDNVLLILTNKVDDKLTKSGWLSALEKMGGHLTLWPILRAQMPQWIIARAKKYKMVFQHDAATLLAEFVEGNLVAAAQVIEKAYLLKPTAAVDIHLLNLILTDESRYSIFDFVENMIAGNHPRALHILDNLKLEGTDPILILWGITRELRLLAELSADIKQGASQDMLFQKHRIFARRQPALKRFLNRHQQDNCLPLLMQAAEIDKILKGAAPGNAWDALQLFCLRIK